MLRSSGAIKMTIFTCEMSCHHCVFVSVLYAMLEIRCDTARRLLREISQSASQIPVVSHVQLVDALP